MEINKLLDLLEMSDFTEIQSNKIYHYTNFNAFMSIVKAENGRNGIWLSNVEYLNDNEEITIGKQLHSNKLKSNCSAVNDYDYYVASFCKDGDSLDQWRSYSANGSGICIEFDLQKNGYFSNLFHENIQPFMTPVVYNEKDMHKIIETFCKSISEIKELNIDSIEENDSLKDIMGRIGNVVAKDALAGTITTLPLVTLPILGTAAIASLIYGSKASKAAKTEATKEIQKKEEMFNNILGISSDTPNEIILQKTIPLLYPLFKNSAFSSEKEIRLIYYNNRNHDFIKKIKYRVASNGMIVPYIRTHEFIPDGAPGLLPISKVIIGPTAKKELVEKSVRFFLDNNNYYGIDVVPSKVPYRG